ncbi:MAG: GTPase domain-containing protein [Phycisphaerales bacterium]|nr:MAG: GTPase domain-containing protein [Phycisphaerales bacterium]
MSTPTNPPAPAGPDAKRLESLNAALAEMFPDRGPALLVADSTACQADSLVLCGVLGGKDVGKSTLINAIAQAPVSEDADEVGRGTARPVAYVHEAEQEALLRRFEVVDGKPEGLQIHTHTAEPARNLVLLDLPDFDSTFTRHLEIVRDAIGRMDRVVWICDPKKIGDRLWGELLPQVVKDPSNVYCVLNKFDLLLRDESGDGLQGAFEQAHRYLEECLASLQVGNDPQQRFVLSAAFPDVERFTGAVAHHWDDKSWTAYSDARPAVEELGRACVGELNRMREMINAPVGPERVRSIKLANQRAEAQANVRAIREHFTIEQHLGALERAAAGLAGEMDARFDREFISVVSERMAREGRSDADLADEVMTHRVEPWPILSTIFWTCRGVVRWLGRRIAPSAAAVRGPSDPWRVHGISLEDRLGAMQVSLRSRFATLLASMKLDAGWPSPREQERRVRGEFEAATERMDQQIVEACRAEYRRPGPLGKLLVWLPLLWFPLIQPLTEGLLETIAAQGMLNTVHGLSLVVRAFGAASLLRGLLIVLLLYVFALAAMYARSLRAVRAARRGPAIREDRPEGAEEDGGEDGAYAELLRQVLAEEAFAPLVAPLEAAHERLRDIDAKLRAIAAETHPGGTSTRAA